jgi:hypothetical protein
MYFSVMVWSSHVDTEKPLSIVSEGTAKSKQMQENIVAGNLFIWVMGEGPEKGNDTSVKTVHV